MASNNNQWFSPIRGIGASNAKLLAGLGITSLQDLTQCYLREPERFEQDLSETARMQPRYIKSLMAFLENEAVPREQEEAAKAAERPAPPLPPVSLCVEGNISAGKSTFLNVMEEKWLEFQDVVEVIPEPVSEWQTLCNSDGRKFNLLDTFYKDPKRYAYTFQNYVFVTRMMQGKAVADKPLRLLERSVFSDRMVFVRAVHKAGWMSDMEMSIYDSWFNPMVEAVPSMVPDGFVYLRADPNTCMRRLKGRARNEEGGIKMEYLNDLHGNHEDWLKGLTVPTEREAAGRRQNTLLFPSETPMNLNRLGTQFSVGTKASFARDLPAVPDSLQGQVIMMDSRDKPGLSGSVPALVLDCNQDYDVTRNDDAKKEYAGKIKAYFEWVQVYRQAARPVLDLDLNEDEDELLQDIKRSLRTHDRQDSHDMRDLLSSAVRMSSKRNLPPNVVASLSSLLDNMAGIN